MTRGKGAHAMAPDADDFDDLVDLVADLPEEIVERFVQGLTGPARRRMFDAWRWQAHGGQRPPRGGWRVWMIMAGRGFGKTRAGAEWISARARADGRARIALVGGSADEVAKVMIEGPSGLIASARTGERPTWLPSRGQLLFASGAEAFVYSSEAPEKLRGPEHHFAWCDELAKWARPDTAWDNLMLGLRLGERPRAIVTTTPRPVPIVKRIAALERCVTTRGRTIENRHLAADYLESVTATYGGTRLGRQELDGELIEDVEGALWKRDLIERCRVSPMDPSFFKRIVIGVDPPAGDAGDACGIVAAGLGADGVGYVLGDHSARGLSPEGWARKVAAAVETWRAHRVIAEVNNGGRMVESVLKGAGLALPVKAVHASQGKIARAEPVATLFEAGKAKFAGTFPELEDELAGFTAGGYQGHVRSPDRADAMVWAMTELMLGGAAPVPRRCRA